VINPKTRTPYLPTADFYPEPASESKGLRPKMIKDSFMVLVVGKLNFTRPVTMET